MNVLLLKLNNVNRLLFQKIITIFATKLKTYKMSKKFKNVWEKAMLNADTEKRLKKIFNF